MQPPHLCIGVEVNQKLNIMKPVNQRTPDNQYKRVLRQVLKEGRLKKKTQQGVGAITLIGPNPMRFNIDNGIPLITERKIGFWRKAVGEIFAMVNGVRTVEGFKEFECDWWGPWGTEKKCRKRGLEPGDLGPGSYGAAFHDFPTVEGEKFNQFENIIKQIKENPQLRTHFISPWIPQYTIRITGRQQKVTICPCHGWILIEIIDSDLYLHMWQRSADLPVGVPSNMIQYAALTLAIAHVTGTNPYQYIHAFGNAHIYEDQVEIVRKMLRRENRTLPTMRIINDKKSIFDFRAEDFEISDYNPHPGIKDIPIAI